jgi:FkbM family methyltransferase
MLQRAKNLIRQVFSFLHLDVTKNMQYDRAAIDVMRKILKKDSVCIDIGCHKGEIMDQMIKFSPLGNHFGFEPIPWLFENLLEKYKGKNVKIYPQAVGNIEKKSSFKIVKNALAYSGLKNREYAIKNPEIIEIEINQVTLNDVFSNLNKLDLIKIDVEGGEYHVIEGAKELIKKLKPALLFEFGKGSAEFYESTPEKMFDLLAELNMNIFLLISFIKNPIPLNKKAFCQIFNEMEEYYFVAFPKK